MRTVPFTTIVLAVIPALALGQGATNSSSPAMTKTKTQSAAAVHASAIVIDTHADTPQRFLDEHFDLGDPRGNGGDWNLETARKGNLGAEFFAIWVDPVRLQGCITRGARWS